MIGMALLCIVLFAVGFLAGDAYAKNQWAKKEEHIKQELLEWLTEQHEKKTDGFFESIVGVENVKD